MSRFENGDDATFISPQWPPAANVYSNSAPFVRPDISKLHTDPFRPRPLSSDPFRLTHFVRPFSSAPLRPRPFSSDPFRLTLSVRPLSSATPFRPRPFRPRPFSSSTNATSTNSAPTISTSTNSNSTNSTLDQLNLDQLSPYSRTGIKFLKKENQLAADQSVRKD